jgi:hypothetical protein
MDDRLQQISTQANNPWNGFCERCRAYLHMAQDPEIQRIVLQDAPAVLGADVGAQQHCIESLRRLLDELMQAGLIEHAPSLALARLINGSLVDTAQWIAHAERPDECLEQALQGLELLLRGLKPNR